MTRAPTLTLDVDGPDLRWERQRLSRDQAARWLRWRRPATIELRVPNGSIRIPRERLLDWLTREEPIDAAVRRELAYETLTVPPESELATVKGAYRRLARLHHPDRGGAPEAMQAINRAYRQLTTRLPALAPAP